MFEVGNVVQLRSGGAKMTVTNTNEDVTGQTVGVLWTDDNEEPQWIEDLSSRCLILVNDIQE